MINREFLDTNLTPMINWVKEQILLDPIGRINPALGTPRKYGAAHTVPLSQEQFSPLFSKINDIATKHFKEYSITDIWSNFNPPGALLNAKHSHPGADIAGCFYLSVPENSGSIVFETGEEFFPNPGDLLWWDASIVHWVTTNHSLEDRYSVAFNITNKHDI